MAYNNNVPLGNQTRASTTDSIRNNFDFLQSSIGKEHNFNASNAAATYHLQASMPNQALSPALPAGTNGAYFVSSASPYFYDGSVNWLLNEWEGLLSGTYTPNSTLGYNNIALIPANKVGIVILYSNTIAGFTLTGWFSTSATRCFGYSNRIKINNSSDDYPVELNNNSASLNLQGRIGAGGSSLAYTYKIFYRPV
jgi:hypothetical protein